jgi:methylated-DNA-[protein]-cysteine S-methyltransferase
MPTTGSTLFDTAIGPCGIPSAPRGIVGVQLPERHATVTRERLQRRYPDVPEASPPPEVQRAIDNVIALLRGEPQELSNVVLDMGGIPAFRQRLYTALRNIPVGSTITYGDLAVPDRRWLHGTRCRRGNGQEPVPDHCSVPPGFGG